MGREVRMVPKDWNHPRYTSNDEITHDRPYLIGRYQPLFERPVDDDTLEKEIAEWDKNNEEWNNGMAWDWLSRSFKPKEGSALNYETYAEWAGDRPNPDDYMPQFSPESATYLQMYETTSEGTPISPPMPTPESLARWLADNNASAFGGMTATYEEWLSACKIGWVPSAVVGDDGNLQSGVASTL